MQNLTYLETFVAVVENGSFTAAAEALGISKPVVSKQITQLESNLGVRLLNRTTRRLHLTEPGEVFFNYGQRILTDLQEAEQAIMPMQLEPLGKLLVTVPLSLAQSLLPETLYSFQQHYPQIKIDLRVSGQFIDLVKEGIDVALRVGELEDSSMISRRLAPCSFQVCASPSYWLTNAQPSHPKDLSEHNCLIYSQTQNPDRWLFKDKNGKDLIVGVDGDLHSDDGGILLSAAVAGQGVMAGPSFMFSKLIANNQLVPVLDDYAKTTMGLFAVFPHSKMVSPKVRVFVDYLVDQWSVMN